MNAGKLVLRIAILELMCLGGPTPIKGAYQGLTDGDISDMADDILALPPVVNAIAGTCEGM